MTALEQSKIEKEYRMNDIKDMGRNGDQKPFKTEVEIPQKYQHQRLAPSITKLNLMISS